jgi:hypothetical protein
MKAKVSYNVNGWLNRSERVLVLVVPLEEVPEDMHWRFPTHVTTGCYDEEDRLLFIELPLEAVQQGCNGLVVHELQPEQ